MRVFKQQKHGLTLTARYVSRKFVLQVQGWLVIN
jgi:hypothetical protein